MEEALSGMFKTEHLERSKLIHDLRSKLQSIKAKVKRKTPPVANLEEARVQLEKDPDVALQPGTLHYSVSPAELENWMSSFEAYVANGKGVDKKMIIAYFKKFLNDKYCQSNIFSQLTEDMNISPGMTSK